MCADVRGCLIPELRSRNMNLELELLLRCAAAALLAGVIGWDRQEANKPAGIRTHMLVGAGAALFAAASILILGDAWEADGRGDAVRIPAGIVAGVGFLGAGAILRTQGGVSGLTTAAGIWVTAAIGVLVGSGFWLLGVGATVLVVAIVNLTPATSVQRSQDGVTSERDS